MTKVNVRSEPVYPSRRPKGDNFEYVGYVDDYDVWLDRTTTNCNVASPKGDNGLWLSGKSLEDILAGYYEDRRAAYAAGWKAWKGLAP